MDCAALFLLFAVDPHLKVFAGDPPPGRPALEVELACARGEYEPAQIVVRAERDLEEVAVEVSPLRHEESGAELPAGTIAWNFVGSIPLERNTPGTPPERLVRRAPCRVPDVLLPDRTLPVPAGSSQPVWLTAWVPRDAAPGVYRGAVTVRAGGEARSLPLRLRVWPFDLPEERHIFATNWFSTSTIARAHGVEEQSEPFWKLLEAYFRNMAAHRQNVAWVPWRLVEVTRKAGGELRFDFSRFDRYVELMERAGVADRIEIQHVAHFGPGGWSGATIEFAKLRARDEATGRSVELSFEEGLAPFLGALERHLEERGWLEKAVLHIADEPSLGNADSWRERSRAARAAAPRFRRIDAIEASDFGGDLEVWVPKLSHLERWLPWYEEARRAGAELWFYVCCHPTGGLYPNRFLDGPLADVRLLQWLPAVYDLRGYLHWGWNHWRGDPFGVPPADLPPGDTHAVYPGPEGPLDSLRWEMEREGREDFEYFWLLAARHAELARRLGSAASGIDPSGRAKELARRLVRGFADLRRDPALISATRRQLAEEIVAAGEGPPVLVATRPAEDWELVAGPIAVEVWGATVSGATVEIQGETCPLRADGSFRRSVGLSERHPRIRVVVRAGALERALERVFRVRN